MRAKPRTFMPAFTGQRPLAAALAFAPLIAWGDSAMAESPYRSERFDLSGLSTLRAETSGGSIEVIGDASDQATVDVYVKTERGSSDADAIAERMKNYELSIRREGDALFAQAREIRHVNREQLSISYRIHIPRDVETRLDTSGGSLHLEGVRGRQDLDTSGGSIELSDIEGNTHAETSGGSISIDRYSGDLVATTSGGPIRAEQGRGNFRLRTSGGSITLEALAGEVDASTSGGSIRAALSEVSGPVSLSTSGGSINATLPAGLGLDLDLSGSRVNAPVSNFTGKAGDSSLKGTINGGGYAVRMRTSGGSVNLRFDG